MVLVAMPRRATIDSPDRRRIRWLAAATFVFIWTLTTHGKYSASGDEPHYLMIAHSIVADHDIDVGNNYAANDGRAFGHDHLDIGRHAVRSRTGRVLSIHDPGLGVVLAPVYFLSRQVARLAPPSLLKRVRMDRGLLTYSLISMFMAALTCFGLAFLATGLCAIAGPDRAAWLVFLAGISSPIASHAFLVFPEVPALFITCLIVWFTLSPPHRRDGARLLVLAALLGGLPWTHHKFLVYSLGLLGLIAWRRADVLRRVPTSLHVAAAVLFVAPQFWLLAWSRHEWGTLGGALTTSGMPFSWVDLKHGLVGLWLDRQAGLLAYAPLYWVVPASGLLSFRRNWDYLIPFALMYLPAAAYVIGWWAGFAPAARYLVPAVPLLLVPVAATMDDIAIRSVVAALVLPQLVIDVVAWQHPRWLWPDRSGNLLLRAIGIPGRAYESFLPWIQQQGVSYHAVWAIFAWAVATGALVLISLKRPSEPAVVPAHEQSLDVNTRSPVRPSADRSPPSARPSSDR